MVGVGKRVNVSVGLFYSDIIQQWGVGGERLTVWHLRPAHPNTSELG